MSETDALLANIELKINRLIEQHRQSLQQIEQCKKQIEKLNQQLEQTQNQLKQKEEQLTLLKIAKALPKGDNLQAKQKINELLREIDRCIAILSS